MQGCSTIDYLSGNSRSLDTSDPKECLTLYKQGHKLFDRLVVFAPDKVVLLRDELDYAWSQSKANELLIVHDKARLLLEAMKENSTMNQTNKLTLEQLLEVIRFNKEAREVLALLDQPNLKFSSLHAVFIVQSLYSPTSSDKANIDRITINLEAAAADLVAISRQLQGLLS